MDEYAGPALAAQIMFGALLVVLGISGAVRVGWPYWNAPDFTLLNTAKWVAALLGGSAVATAGFFVPWL